MAYEFVAKVEEKHQGTKLPYVVETPWDLTFGFINKDEAERCARDLNSFLNAYGDFSAAYKDTFKKDSPKKKEKEDNLVNTIKPAASKN